MNIEVDDTGDILLSNVYNPVIIADDTHKYGVANRDGGLEIVCGGELIAVFRHGKCTIPEGLLEKEAQLAKGRVRYETCRYLDTRGPEGFCQVYKHAVGFTSFACVYEACAACASFRGISNEGEESSDKEVALSNTTSGETASASR